MRAKEDPAKVAARQKRFRARKKKLGKCAWCANPAVPKTSLCEKCHRRSRLRARAKNKSKAWTPLSPGRPPSEAVKV